MGSISQRNQKQNVFELNTKFKREMKEEMLKQLLSLSDAVKITRDVTNEEMISIMNTVWTLTLKSMLRGTGGTNTVSRDANGIEQDHGTPR